MRSRAATNDVGILRALILCFSIAGLQEPSLVGQAASADERTEASKDVVLEAKTWEQVQAWVKQQKGRVVVLDLWSTWCTSCVHEFPHFVALHKQKLPRVTCASLSLDFYGDNGEIPADVREQVIAFLQKQGGPAQNFIAADGDEAVLKKIKAAAIPIALVFDHNGKLHTTFKNDQQAFGPNGFTYEKDIVPLVTKLSAEAQASGSP